jgi:hypothetical protein
MLIPATLATPYVLMPIEFDTFVSIIENLQTPSEHVSMMGKYIRKKKFWRFKITWQPCFDVAISTFNVTWS